MRHLAAEPQQITEFPRVLRWGRAKGPADAMESGTRANDARHTIHSRLHEGLGYETDLACCRSVYIDGWCGIHWLHQGGRPPAPWA
jgi:hypothetical protein